MKEIIKMDPDLKNRWIKALRSGEYQQGKAALRPGNGYCCLGVLCDVVRSDIGLEWEFDGIGYSIGGSISSLPIEVSEYTKVGPLGTFSKNMALSIMNDTGSTFKQIADVIEDKF